MKRKYVLRIYRGENGWPFLCHHIFMCEITKCHINSWLLLFLAAWAILLHLTFHSIALSLPSLPPSLPSHSLPLSTAVLSLSVSFRPLQCTLPYVVTGMSGLVFGSAMCSTGRQPAQCVEPQGCGDRPWVSLSLTLSLRLWLVAGLPGHERHHITEHLLLLTSLQPGGTHTHTQTNCPLASLTLFTDKAAFGSAVEFATAHP